MPSTKEIFMCFHQVRVEALSRVAKKVLQRHYPKGVFGLEMASDDFKRELVKKYIQSCNVRESNELVSFVCDQYGLKLCSFFNNNHFWDYAQIAVLKLYSDEIENAIKNAQTRHRQTGNKNG